jgi:hypothetical protein
VHDGPGLRSALARRGGRELDNRERGRRTRAVLLAALTSTGQYETITAPTGGRPSVRYRRTQGTKKEERTNPAPGKTTADQRGHHPDGEHLSSYPTKKAPRPSFVAG